MRHEVSDEYRFVTDWRAEETCGVADELFDPTTLTEWWPSVYLEVRAIAPP